jgi:hypothetical protein
MAALWLMHFHAAAELSRCSELVYTIHAGMSQFNIVLPHSFSLQRSFISHVARYASSSRQLLEQNNTTIQYKLILNTYLSEHPFYYTMKILRETLLFPYERQIYKNSGNKNYLTPLFISRIS